MIRLESDIIRNQTILCFFSLRRFHSAIRITVPNINIAGSTLTFVMTLTQFEYLISSFSKRGETANTIHVCAHVLTGHYFDRQPRALVCISFPSTSTSRLLFMVCKDCYLIVPGYLISQHLSLFINKHDS